MDYSATINEADDPAASPWGNNSPGSSPQQSRTGFENINNGPPSSPFPYNPHVAAEGDGDEFHRPGTANTESGTEGGDIEHSATLDSTAAVSEGEAQADISEHPTQASSQPPGPRQEPPAPEPASKPPHSQFKLQAKITGLERTGKKDPVLRFDVHVRHLRLSCAKSKGFVC